MKINNSTLNSFDQISQSLRDLYTSNGYSLYKMSKFEEYDLYSRNKDFLMSEGIITFTDTNGKLMALKPDVTLSIIRANNNKPQKLWYNENVYRIAKPNNTFKEIMQIGLECLGNIDIYCRYEVLQLAIESLLAISDKAVLSLCHLGIISELLDKITLTAKQRSQIIKCISEKNIHEMALISDDPNIEILQKLASMYGPASKLVNQLEQLVPESVALAHLKAVLKLFDNSKLQNYLYLDFSVISDLTYYNGLVFKGFIESVPSAVLSGGQYDKLMAKMGRKIGALGFAVYMDDLESFAYKPKDYDFDYLLLYDVNTDLTKLIETKEKLINQGYTVLISNNPDENLRFKNILKGETNA